MGHLYKFSCAPNYPVVSEAFVLFHTGTHPNHWEDARLEGQKLAESVGIVYTNDKQTLIYLGEIEVIKSFRYLPILVCVTGEY